MKNVEIKKDIEVQPNLLSFPNHYHCPNGCEKPQPMQDGNKIICLRCIHEGRGEVEMYLCTPEVCD